MEWTLTLTIAAIFAALVFGGTLYYLRATPEMSTLKKLLKAGIWAAIAFAGVCLLSWITEVVGEM